MVGNSTDALTALTAYNECDDSNLLSDVGTTRMVYLINDVVYKVDRVLSNSENAWEYEHASKIRGNLPTGVRIPEMELYTFYDDSAGTIDFVLACEFVTGFPTGECLDQILIGCEHLFCRPCLPFDRLDELRYYGWTDHSWGNAMWSKGILYLVDVA